jgi:2-succinyl-5-enolpyruvyl-6-hydroxy-3-cyclohexene-1-carboxylate synthase
LSAVTRAVTGPEPGPIHFNLHSPKPLEIIAPQDDEDRALEALVTTLLADVPNPTLPGRLCPHEDSVERLASAVEREPSGLIAVGFEPEEPPMDPLSLMRLARVSGYPVLLDVAHPLRQSCPPELMPYVVAPFEPLLRLDEWHKTQPPRMVIQLGRPLTSSSWERWLNGLHSDQLLIVARRGWPDPTGHGQLVSNADPTEFLSAVAERLEADSPRSSGWQARWLRAAAILNEVISRTLSAPASAGPLDELSAVHALLRALPDESRLVVGNSLPIRHIDLIAGKSLAPQLTVYAIRGASGIDGVTSTAVGVALSSEVPTTLLIGDISFLHDIGGLWAAQETQAPLAVVVLNNGGGRIFEQLPLSKVVNSTALAAWTTPQHLELSHAAALYGLAYLRVTSCHGLVDALNEAHSHPGTTVIDVALPPSSAKTQTDQLLALMSAALEQQGLLSPPSGSASS